MIGKTYIVGTKDGVRQWVELTTELTPEQISAIAAEVPNDPPLRDDGKVDKVAGSDLLAITEAAKIHALNADNQDLSNLVVKVTNKSLVLDTEIAKIHSSGSDNQDLSGLNVKRLFTNLAAAVVTSGTTEKVLLQLQIPAARAVVGSTFRAWVVGNSSSTGTLIFRIKCGANGSISDTEDWKSVTSAAQAANARAGFECLITIRSATTIAVDGVGYAGAVQLPTTIAVPATPVIVIANQWYINMTVVCSSGTFTAQVASIEEIR